MSDSNDIAKKIIEAGEKLAGEDFSGALAILEPLVAAHVPAALTIVGTMYQLGMGVPASGVKAVELLKAAAEAGDALGAHNLGTLYATGASDVEQNSDLSLAYHQLARKLDPRLGLEN